MKKIRSILWDQRAASFPLTICMVLALMILFCGFSEYFRLQIIAIGVREAVEDAVIAVVNDNYAGVYHGAREGYSGSYQPFGGGWEETLNEGDIYSYLDSTLGTRLSGGRHVKFAGDQKDALEYAIDSLSVTIRNAPLAPSDPQNVQRFEAEAEIELEVPVRFGGKVLPSVQMHLNVQAGYTEVF